MPSTCRIPEAISATTPVVLANHFPQGKNMAHASTSTSTIGGSQGPLAPTNINPAVNIYMMNAEAHLATRARDYGMSESTKKGKEATNPSTPLQIEKVVGETMTHILKGAFKKASHNPNIRAAHNYSFVEDLAQTLVRCSFWNYSKIATRREKLCCLPWEWQRLVTQE